MSHHDETLPNNNQPTKSYWEKELEKPSLKEPPLKSKFFWLKPLTPYHSLEFRGIYFILYYNKRILYFYIVF